VFKLRFYLGDTAYEKERNNKILNLLNQIRKKHGIDYEIFNLKITKEGYVDERHEKEVYETHFRPRAKVLKKRVRIPLPRALRSQRGRGHYYISGVIAILENGQVGWYTCWKSCSRFREFDEDYTIGFLKALLSRGLSLIRELCYDITPSKSLHDFLVDEFIKINPIRAKIKREVKVGSMFFENKYGSVFDWRKSIDLVGYSKNSVWIIEVKPKLNWEAFGQVIAYAHLFQKENPSFKIQKGIVCKEIDPEILAICEEFNIKVFVWHDGKFEFAKL